MVTFSQEQIDAWNVSRIYGRLVQLGCTNCGGDYCGDIHYIYVGGA